MPESDLDRDVVIASIESGARGRSRTGTKVSLRGILNPLRLPIPPLGLIKLDIE
jgi:hypothetical protein